MTIGAGIFHRMDNDWEITWDVLWVEFSRFGVTEIKLSELDIDVSSGAYEDFYATTVGLSFPLRPNMRGSIGALYVEQPVNDVNRSFGITVDEMWGIGAGVNLELDNGDDMDINLNLLDTGRAPIDTGHHPISGRVAGEFDNHYSMMLELSYHWR
jgi:long-chain fatty acid transport protein